MPKAPSFAPSTPALCLPYALIGVVLGQLTMVLVGANTHDHRTYLWGLGFCAAVGAFAGSVGSRASAQARRTWTLAGGALAGVGILSLAAADSLQQLADQGDPVKIVGLLLVGTSLGMMPAFVVVALDVAASACASELPSADSRERTMMPFAAACALAAAFSIVWVEGVDAYVSLAVLGLAFAALLEILLRDRGRARFLHRVLDGEEPGHALVPLAAPRCDVPLAVGGVHSGALVMQSLESTSYRAAAQAPLFQTSLVHAFAVAPLRQRARIILCVQGASLLLAVGAAVLPALTMWSE